MSATDLLARTINGLPVEVLTFAKGDGALVFVDTEYVGSAERDCELHTWTAFPIHREGEPTPADGMWSAVRRVVHAHIFSSMKAALAR